MTADQTADRGAALAHAADTWVIVRLCVVVLLWALIGWVMVRTLSVPLSVMTASMRRLADRDLATIIPSLGRKDEIGSIAEAVQVFKDNMITANEVAAEQNAERAAKERRRLRLEAVVHGCEEKAHELVGLLAAGSTELEATAQSMTSTAAQTDQQAMTVAAAAEQASAGVQTSAALP